MVVPHSKRPFCPSAALGVDPERIDAHDAPAHAQLDAHLLELLGGSLAQAVTEVGQRLLPAVDQEDPDGGGVDVAEVAGQAAGGQLADLPGQLHTGRPAADDGEGHEEALLGRVGPRLGDLEGAEDPPPELHGVIDGLHPRCDHGEFVVAEVGLAGAGRHDQAVVGIVGGIARDGLGVHDPLLEVEPGDLRQDDLDVLVAAHHVTQHRRDLTRREDARGHLVEERLEQVVVPPVDQRDVDVGARQQAGGRQAAEAASDHDHPVTRRRAHGALPLRPVGRSARPR